MTSLTIALQIVGTIGPVSESAEMTQRLVDEGLRIMRINFSHAEYDEALMRTSSYVEAFCVRW